MPAVMGKPVKMFETVPEYVIADDEHVLRQINLEEGAKPEEMTLMLTSGVDVTGYVVDPEGKRLADVLANGNIQQAWYPILGEEFRVEGYYPDRPRDLFFYDPSRDLAGYYRLEGPPPKELEIKLQPAGSLSGTTFERQGSPLAGHQAFRQWSARRKLRQYFVAAGNGQRRPIPYSWSCSGPKIRDTRTERPNLGRFERFDRRGR